MLQLLCRWYFEHLNHLHPSTLQRLLALEISFSRVLFGVCKPCFGFQLIFLDDFFLRGIHSFKSADPSPLVSLLESN